MTSKDNAIKKAARKRQALTGESYTEALRAVVTEHMAEGYAKGLADGRAQLADLDSQARDVGFRLVCLEPGRFLLVDLRHVPSRPVGKGWSAHRTLDEVAHAVASIRDRARAGQPPTPELNAEYDRLDELSERAYETGRYLLRIRPGEGEFVLVDFGGSVDEAAPDWSSFDTLDEVEERLDEDE